MFNALPDDVCRYKKAKHNKFLFGSPFTIMELYERIPSLEEKWGDHCKEFKIKSRTCATQGEYTYAKIYRRFILKLDEEEEVPAFDGNFNIYTHAKVFLHEMKKRGWWSSYQDLVENHCNFLARGLKIDCVCAANHLFMNRVLQGPFSDWDPERQKLWLMAGLESFLPLVNTETDPSRFFMPWLHNGEQDIETLKKDINLMATPMGGTVNYKAKAKVKAKDGGKRKAGSAIGYETECFLGSYAWSKRALEVSDGASDAESSASSTQKHAKHAPLHAAQDQIAPLAPIAEEGPEEQGPEIELALAEQ
eukprot:9467504-Pyramimonas_sp.AAC.1